LLIATELLHLGSSPKLPGHSSNPTAEV
jgi:hypothetical protein